MSSVLYPWRTRDAEDQEFGHTLAHTWGRNRTSDPDCDDELSPASSSTHREGTHPLHHYSEVGRTVNETETTTETSSTVLRMSVFLYLEWSTDPLEPSVVVESVRSVRLWKYRRNDFWVDAVRVWDLRVCDSTVYTQQKVTIRMPSDNTSVSLDYVDLNVKGRRRGRTI